MIGLVFTFASEQLEVRIIGAEVLFRTSQFMKYATIDGIKISKPGTLKEFPDLKDNDDWEKIAKERFKEKIKEFNSEMETANYIIEELKKYGYVPKYRQREGHRPERL